MIFQINDANSFRIEEVIRNTGRLLTEEFPAEIIKLEGADPYLQLDITSLEEMKRFAEASGNPVILDFTREENVLTIYNGYIE